MIPYVLRRPLEGDKETTTKPGFRGELTSALGAKDVLYDVSTATRRRLLIDMFDRARTQPGDGTCGMLVHIGSSPYELIDLFADDPVVGGRAQQAGALLDRLTDLETDTPDGDFSTVFGQAGSSSTLQLHIFDGNRFSRAVVRSLINEIKRAVSGKRFALTGFVMTKCLVNTTGIFSIPAGQQGILTLDVTTRTV